MQRFQHLSGMAAIALTALGLSACYPPPPGTVAVAPTEAPTVLPPQPPPYYVPPAAATVPPYSPTGVAQAYGPTRCRDAAVVRHSAARDSQGSPSALRRKRRARHTRLARCAAPRSRLHHRPMCRGRR